jgi:ATP-dependent RNA helicase RhlE
VYNVCTCALASSSRVSFMQESSENTQQNFYGLGIAPGVLETLSRAGFTTPTPIQTRSIPLLIQGKDLVGIAQTGTGKTLAFGIPMIQILVGGRGQGLVVLPTRELALQVEGSLRKIGGRDLRTAILIGGLPFGLQRRDISRKPHIIVGTPGRINDHLLQKTLSLSLVSMVVLDEADRMFDMGFLPQIRSILQAVPKERQTMLFSATMPAEIMKLAKDYMKTPLRVEIAPPGTTVEGVSQELFVVAREQKPELLKRLLLSYKGPTLVFTRTKYGAKKVARQIRDIGIRSSEIHSNRSLSQRREALDGFKSGKYRVLVATDIASRGIDVRGIELVLNYDLPSTSDDYVHRIGRTARAGTKGHAITFAMTSEGKEVRAIERVIQKRLSTMPLPEGFAPAPRLKEAPRPVQRQHRGYARPRTWQRKAGFGRQSSRFR